MLKRLFIVLLLMFSFFGYSVHAQVKDSDVSLSINPASPKPNESITAVLSSYVIDLNKANISWSTNGTQIAQGVGKKSISFNSGSLGSNIIVKADIITLDGKNVVKSASIAPSDVDIIWEAYDSYSPPFYRGKTLVDKEGMFKVVVVPGIVTQNGRINTNNLSYVWTRDGNGQPDASGWGKSAFIFKNSYLEPENEIEVEVSDISGSIATSGKITLKPSPSKIVFYKYDPLMGITLNKALGDSFTLDNGGNTIVAVPYFFSPKNLNSSELDYKWILGGEEVLVPNIKNQINLKPEDGKKGSSTVEINISNTNTLFQENKKEINVNF